MTIKKDDDYNFYVLYVKNNNIFNLLLNTADVDAAEERKQEGAAGTSVSLLRNER